MLFDDLKYIHSIIQPSSLSSIRTFFFLISHENPMPIKQSFTFSPQLWTLLICHCSFWIFQTHETIHQVDPLHLASLIKINIFQVHSYCSTYQYFIYFYVWLLLHHILSNCSSVIGSLDYILLFLMEISMAMEHLFGRFCFNRAWVAVVLLCYYSQQNPILQLVTQIFCCQLWIHFPFPLLLQYPCHGGEALYTLLVMFPHMLSRKASLYLCSHILKLLCLPGVLGWSCKCSQKLSCCL